MLDNSYDYTILIHGFQVAFNTDRGVKQMQPIANFLKQHEVKNILIFPLYDNSDLTTPIAADSVIIRTRYRTRRVYWDKDISLAKKLESFIIEKIPDGASINFVAHSMGGLVVRSLIKYFSNKGYIENRKIRKAILIATPNKGTEITKFMEELSDLRNNNSLTYTLFREVIERLIGIDLDMLSDLVISLKEGDPYKTAIQVWEIMTENEIERYKDEGIDWHHSFSYRLNEGGEALYDILYYTISGTKGSLVSPLLHGKDDGVVPLDSTYLDGAAGQWEFELNHDELLKDERVHSLIYDLLIKK